MIAWSRFFVNNDMALCDEHVLYGFRTLGIYCRILIDHFYDTFMVLIS